MNQDLRLEILSNGPEDTSNLGVKLAEALDGGEVIELIGDLGTGKTQFVRGVARGLGSKDVVQSPSFTISRIYQATGDVYLHHFDLYRLGENTGIIKTELQEVLNDPLAILVSEWADSVHDILPKDRVTINFIYMDGEKRRLLIKSNGPKSRKIVEYLS
jgi:tRNA threonylcarbamoyladenosine biosynthesis protein TsaE